MFSKLLPDNPGRAGAIVTAGSSALLIGAFGFEHIGGLAPCALCLDQRWWHAAAIAYGLLTMVLSAGAIARLMGAGAIVAIFMSAAFGLYHMGIESAWWAGPAECTGSGAAANLSVQALTDHLLSQPAVMCDEVPWSLFGISMAGWNVIVSSLFGFAALIVMLIPSKGEHDDRSNSPQSAAN